MKKVIIISVVVAFLSACQYLPKQEKIEQKVAFLPEINQEMPQIHQKLSDNEVVKFAFDTLDALHSFYYASIDNRTGKEDLVDTMVTLMQRNKDFEAGIATLTQYLNHKNEVIRLSASGMMLGADKNIQANNNLLNFLKTLDKSNPDFTKLNVLTAESISIRKDGFVLIMLSASQIANLIFEPALSDNPTGEIHYKVSSDSRKKIINEISRLFADNLSEVDNSNENAEGVNAILLAVSNIKENLIFDTYEELDRYTQSKQEKPKKIAVKTAIMSVPDGSTLRRAGNNAYYVHGYTSDNCEEIVVTAINTDSVIHDVYRLIGYKKGDTTFKYGIREDWNNLGIGENEYTFVANCEGGQKVQDKLIITIPTVQQPFNTTSTYNIDNNQVLNNNYYPTDNVIETKIDGEFDGWDGESIFKMMDGSIWQQASYAYVYHYAYMPDVLIYKKDGSSYMKVDGVDDAIEVTRLK